MNATKPCASVSTGAICATISMFFPQSLQRISCCIQGNGGYRTLFQGSCRGQGEPSAGAFGFGQAKNRFAARVVLVGVAGFEPATWSTQNSRATRLRYTPRGAGRRRPFDTRLALQQQAALRCRRSAHVPEKHAPRPNTKAGGGHRFSDKACPRQGGEHPPRL
jgi:hypothetical protein